MNFDKLKGIVFSLIFVCFLTMGCTNRFFLNSVTCTEPSKEAYYCRFWNSKKLFLELIGIKNGQCVSFIVKKEKGVPHYLGVTKFEPVYDKNSQYISYFHATYPLGDTYVFFKNDTLYRNEYFFNKADTSEFEIVNRSYIQKMKSLNGNIRFSEKKSFYQANPIEFKAKVDSLFTLNKNH